MQGDWQEISQQFRRLMIVALTRMVGGQWWVIGCREEELIWRWSWASLVLDRVWDVRRESKLSPWVWLEQTQGRRESLLDEMLKPIGGTGWRSPGVCFWPHWVWDACYTFKGGGWVGNWSWIGREEVCAGNKIWASAAMRTVEIFWTHSQLTSLCVGCIPKLLFFPYLSSFCWCQSLASHCCLLKVIWVLL